MDGRLPDSPSACSWKGHTEPWPFALVPGGPLQPMPSHCGLWKVEGGSCDLVAVYHPPTCLSTARVGVEPVKLSVLWCWCSRAACCCSAEDPGPLAPPSAPSPAATLKRLLVRWLPTPGVLLPHASASQAPPSQALLHLELESVECVVFPGEELEQSQPDMQQTAVTQIRGRMRVSVPGDPACVPSLGEERGDSWCLPAANTKLVNSAGTARRGWMDGCACLQ